MNEAKTDFVRLKPRDIIPGLDNKWLIPLIASGILWWLSTFFITKEQYIRDQEDLTLMLQEVRHDVKDLLKRTY